MELGNAQPLVRGKVPGPAGAALVELLASVESPGLTARRARRRERAGVAQDPLVWTEARGANVVDADGNVYVDLTSGFGAAFVGHTHPRVSAAVALQSGKLLHALGDVHPSDMKVRLLARLAEMAPWPDARVMLGTNGSDAVEAAIKTAVLATGKAGVLAFDGAYHGLSLGALSACGYAVKFRAPFAAHLSPQVRFAPYPGEGVAVAEAMARVTAAWGDDVGAVLVEPILGRGGVVVPPAGFLAALAAECTKRGALLIADEVLTGLGRTGAVFRSVADGAVPDVICLGKALGGGLPVSACIARAETMAAWGDPSGEAIHTATFFGNPVACAAALAALDVVNDEQLAARAVTEGTWLRGALRAVLQSVPGVNDIRGEGLLLGVNLGDGARTLRVVAALLSRGYITLPAGAGAEVLQIMPPATIARPLLEAFITALRDVLGETA